MNLKISFILSIILSCLWGASLYSDSVDLGHISLELSNTSASSTLIEKDKHEFYYGAHNAFDGKSGTAWCEGKSDDGIGESVTAEFEPVKIYGVSALNGIGPTRTIYFKNNRIKDVMFTLYLEYGKIKTFKATFKDNACSRDLAGGKMDIESFCMEKVPDFETNKKGFDKCIREKNDECYYSDYDGGGQRFLLKTPVVVNKIKIEILSVYPGSKFKDTCVADINLIFLVEMGDDTFNNLEEKKY